MAHDINLYFMMGEVIKQHNPIEERSLRKMNDIFDTRNVLHYNSREKL